jgi:hypothetical protein
MRGLRLPPCGLPAAVGNEPAKRARGVPLGMSILRPEHLAPELSTSHVFLREEPDEDDDENEDDGEKDGDDNDDLNNDDGDDDGYSP